MKRNVPLVFLFWLILVPAAASAVVIQVPGDFPTIQAAINAAAFSGDEIVVAPGTYPEVINFNGKAINLHSASGNPADTIIDGTGLNDSVVLCISGEGAGTILEGFTITGDTGYIQYKGSPDRNGGGQQAWSQGVVNETQHLLASGGAAGDDFGIAVALSGDVALVGAFGGDTSGGVSTGSANVYRYNGVSWVEEAHLFASDGALNDNFGVSVALAGDVALVGAHRDGTSAGAFAGSVYVYRFNGATWVEEAHLFASDGAADDLFGNSVALAGNVVLVGAMRDNTSGGVDAGSAYVYRFNGATWVEEAHLFAAEGAGTVLAGFTITGGTGHIPYNGAPFSSGGGMLNLISSPIVTNCTFSGNTAGGGGGMANGSDGNPIVTNCTFTGNISFAGGGMRNGSTSNPVVTNCTFSGNTVTSFGGGMYNSNSNPTVTNCTFSGNSTLTAGGGMTNDTSNPMISNCTFSGNTSNYVGGGIFNSLQSNPTLTNCTFSGNIATNLSGGGINNDQGNLTVNNCIFWGNSPDGIFDNNLFPGFFTIAISFSILQDGLPGWATDDGGNIVADPLFVDADGPDNIPGTPDDDLRLLPFSPGTDAGDNTAPGLGGIVTDLGGAPRFFDDAGVVDTGMGLAPIVDMGAYERQSSSAPVCGADLIPAGGNGVVNIDDLVAVLSGFGSCPAPPTTCPADITPVGPPAGNGVVNIDDLVAVLGAFGPCP